MATLFVVATPIGNLGDITLRAADILRSAQIIACEDTRRTRKLLSHLKLSKKLLSLHQFNETSRVDKILGMLREGQDVALVSDAGTPTLSDPGQLLIGRVARDGHRVEPIPGASAVAAALCAAGMPADRFVFEGFLPRRRAARRAVLEGMLGQARTMVFFETAGRLGESLCDMNEIFGDRQAVMAREITKRHEEFVRLSLGALEEKIRRDGPPRGEIVLVVEGKAAAAPARPDAGAIRERFAQLCGQGMGRKEAMRTVVKEKGVSRNVLYKTLLEKSASRDEGADA